MIRISAESSLLHGFDDAPIGLAREERRGALDYQESADAEVLGGQAIEGGGEELAERVTGGIWEIGDDEVEAIGIGIEPTEGVGVDDVDARRGERMLIQPGEDGVRGEQVGHFGIEIH